jgi:hypothetical protein
LHFSAISLALLLPLGFLRTSEHGSLSAFLGNRGRKTPLLRLDTTRGSAAEEPRKRGNDSKTKPTPQAGATFFDSSLAARHHSHLLPETTNHFLLLNNRKGDQGMGVMGHGWDNFFVLCMACMVFGFASALSLAVTHL